MRRGSSHRRQRSEAGPSMWRPVRVPRPHPDPPPSPPALPGFTIQLVGALASEALGQLIASCPTRPDSCSTQSGPTSTVVRLLYSQWRNALDVFSYLWARRLAGAHQLTPRLLPAPSDWTEEEARLRPLFAAHARGLLHCDAVRGLEHRAEQLAAHIQRFSHFLARPNRLKAFGELQEKRKGLAAEKEMIGHRLEEFRRAIRCILGRLGELEEEGEEEDVEVLWFGGELDWGRMHRVMVRECRRLEDGLPIYGCRRKILKTIVDNQVLLQFLDIDVS